MPKLQLDSLEWHSALANLFENVGESEFPTLLSNMLFSLTPYDSIAVYTYLEGVKPKMLFHNIPDALVDVTLTNYVDGPYLLDPITQACARGISSGVYHLGELAPDHFRQSEYYKRYYQQIGLRDESVVLIMLEPGYYVTLSIGHRHADQGKISSRDLQRLKKVAPVLISAGRMHWSMALEKHPQKLRYRSQVDQLSKAFDSFGSEELTSREREIAREILKGHSGKSIARMLNISLETVKVHRKHINNKLGVSSHAQLFTLFINHLAGSTGTEALPEAQ
jgi:DNA-binding CsgD family transcriptional regulator